MNQSLRCYVLLFCVLMATTALHAQNTINTQPVGTTSLCPGSTIAVPFTRTGTYTGSNVFTVQLSDGGDYRNLETNSLSFNSSTGVYSVQATIPATQVAGTTYTLRVIASSPAVVGTPSPSLLAIREKPVPPIVPSTITECARAIGSIGQAFLIVSLTATVGRATTNLYGTTIVDKRQPDVYTLARPGAGAYTYQATQTVDGCESDRAAIKLIIKPLPTDSRPLNVYGYYYNGQAGGGLEGKIAYCLNDRAVSLREFGLEPLPENVSVSYQKESGDLVFTGYPPVPNTDKAGTAVYRFQTYLDGCSSTLTYSTRLTVTVKPQPGKPGIPGDMLLACEGKPIDPSSVSTVATNATLVWYATTATGGISSTTVTAPSTATVGTAAYYVAQRVDGCESERTPVTVDVRPLPTAVLTGTQRIYEGQSAKLSVAFTGDAPWTFSVQDSSATGAGAVQSVQTAANPHMIDVNPTVSTAYVLRDVRNGCGTTTLRLTPVLVTVEKVLGVEDQVLAEAIDVYPVPATTTLTVRLRGLSPAQTARIELVSETGLAAWQTETRHETSVLSLDQQPAGVYVLRVRVGDRTASRRIIKR